MNKALVVECGGGRYIVIEEFDKSLEEQITEILVCDSWFETKDEDFDFVFAAQEGGRTARCLVISEKVAHYLLKV